MSIFKKRNTFVSGMDFNKSKTSKGVLFTKPSPIESVEQSSSSSSCNSKSKSSSSSSSSSDSSKQSKSSSSAVEINDDKPDLPKEISGIKLLSGNESLRLDLKLNGLGDLNNLD